MHDKLRNNQDLNQKAARNRRDGGKPAWRTL